MSDWAKKAVSLMTNDEVRYWSERFGLRPEMPRAPIEQLVDEAVKPKRKPRRPARKGRKT